MEFEAVFASVTPGRCANMTNARSDSIPAGHQGRILSRLQELAIYAANILLIGGAVLISVLPDSASSPLIFGGFFVGHACLSLHSIRIQDRGLLFLNASMAMLDLYALGIRL